MEIVYDFLEGRCDYQVFIKQLYRDKSIFNWLQSLYREEMLEDSTFRCENALWRANGNVKACIDNKKAFCIGVYVRNDIYNFLYYYLTYALPERPIQRIDHYEKLAHLYTNAVPDCFGGPEVDGLISDIIESVPEGLSKTQTVKYVKDRLKELFPWKKRPFWIEMPEWPVSNGKPMEYISKKSDGDLFLYLFRDPETGEERIVKQFA